MARKPAVQSTVDQIKDQAFSELQALIEESNKLLEGSASLTGADGDTLREQVSAKLKKAVDSLANARDIAVEQAKPVVDATENYIGGHPWQTVAISAGVGVLVGLLIGRRD